jgi:hypothetical protein
MLAASSAFDVGPSMTLSTFDLSFSDILRPLDINQDMKAAAVV